MYDIITDEMDIMAIRKYREGSQNVTSRFASLFIIINRYKGKKLTTKKYNSRKSKTSQSILTCPESALPYI